MVTNEVIVKDGTVYTLKSSVSAGDAIEYIEKFMTKDDTELPKVESEVDEDGKKKEKTFAEIMTLTCKNMEDVEWLAQHVVVAKAPICVPLHHAYELLAPMRKAIHFPELLDVVNSMRSDPDPDFPEEPEKN